ncbi:MAG: Nif3-like dinuclear metal center hexameric protein [Bacteroidales bacterium]|nr:Nif3-like dinuclear metal center hexameric protein [Bacteroidales bacterium]
MKLQELCSFLDSAIPLSLQEGYDNSGLQVGLPDNNVKSALLTLDVTEEVLDEASSGGFDLIISHHPVIFSGIKRLSGKSLPERIIIKAVKKDIAIYSAHTNLDVLAEGVSRKMADKLGLIHPKVLKPLKNKLLKLVTFIPESHLDQVRTAVFNAGAGVIGAYDYCGFSTEGTGSFRGGPGTNPFAGRKGRIHFEKEARFETVLFSHLKDQVTTALIKAHPYEEVAYDIYSLENDNINIGFGCIGELPVAKGEKDFLKSLSQIFDAKGIRFSGADGKNIKRVAVCGGAGISLLNDAIAAGADAFITSDIKYHSYLEAEKKILLADIGHYESEKLSVEILYGLIIKKFPKFAVRISKINTNPINHF